MSEDFTPEGITEKLAAMGVVKQEDEKVSEPETERLSESEPEKDTNDRPSVEDEASAKGWKPGGEKSAEEFLRAEPLYQELKSRGKEIKELKQTLDELKAHQDKQIRMGYEQAMRELQAKREDAISMGDIDAVNEVEEQMKYQEESLNVKPEAELSSAAKAFGERHKEWLNDPSYESQQMREFVQTRDSELMIYGMDPEEHIKIIEKDLKTKFPSYFSSREESVEEVNKFQSVESGGNSGVKVTRKAKYGFSDLNSEQKRCARHFEKRGIMSTDDYIKQLVTLGELK